MKKILVILFGIMMICQACSAEYVPDSSRWYQLGANEKNVYYFDTKSIEFSREFDGIHAVVWVMSVPKKENGEARLLLNEDYNLSRREARMMAYQQYSAKGKLRYHNSYGVDRVPFKGIAPGTVQEAILEKLYTIYNMRMQNNAG